MVHGEGRLQRRGPGSNLSESGAPQLLEGRVPLEVATETEYGADAVVEILGRLKYGSAA
ncbi:antitoxin Xre/MbcA/ParS toxin-binding domain-containing protein [Aquisalimonas sp. 2447]|uniref:antitoxin Xre/MbcA/ParS toxin-binding domain-containing protein n=1 Tax=Aquisalimonas sp. 2447 TaxID=2740807 RepID=UPI0035300E83